MWDLSLHEGPILQLKVKNMEKLFISREKLVIVTNYDTGAWDNPKIRVPLSNQEVEGEKQAQKGVNLLVWDST